MKRKHQQLSLTGMIVHVIIENANRKAIQATKTKEIVAKSNLVEAKPHSKRYDSEHKNKKQKDKQNSNN